VKDWEVEVRLEKERTALGEPIIVFATATARGRGNLTRCALTPGQPNAPTLELRRNGGAPEQVRFPREPGGVRSRFPGIVRPGDVVEANFDLRQVRELGAGAYEAVLELADGSRSAPFRFVVEDARSLLWATAPSDPTGVGGRVFARVGRSTSGPRLVVTRRELDDRVTVDLGPVVGEGKLAVSVQSPDLPDKRQWVVLMSGRTLARTFVDAEPYAHGFAPAPIPAEATELVGALGGTRVAPSPPPRPKVPADGRIRIFDETPWPELHVLLASRPSSGPSRLFGVTLAPSVSSTPAIATCDLPRRFLAGAAVPLSPTSRFAFAAVPGDKGAGIELLAFAWNASGFGPQVRLARSPGALLALDAVALESGGARAAVLVVERREKEKDDALFVREARVDPKGVVQELPPRLVASGEPIKVLANARLRLAGDRAVHVLATHTKLRQSVLIEEGADEPWPVKVPEGAPWDLEILPSGGLGVVFLDPDRGVSSETIEPPEGR
jgi:hypothetical protein